MHLLARPPVVTYTTGMQRHAAILVALLTIPACAEGEGADGFGPVDLVLEGDASGGPDEDPERLPKDMPAGDTAEDETDVETLEGVLCVFDFDVPFECPDTCTGTTWDGDRVQVCGDYLCEKATGGPVTWICEPGTCTPMVDDRGSDCSYTAE